MSKYKNLQNGSDIRGVAVATPDGPEVNLTNEVAERIALGFLIFLQDKLDTNVHSLRVAVGRDSRISGPSILKSVSGAMSSAGANVMSADLASTPAMFMSTVFPEFDADGAIMITASHMPPNRNGMKFFTKDGGLEKEDISKILEFADSDDLFATISNTEGRASGAHHFAREGSISDIPLMDRYCAHLRDIIVRGLSDDSNASSESESPLSGLSITVDAGNGAGGFYAEKVLAPLGADVSSSQFLEPDGNFPNHIPNPEDKAAMASICQRVKEAKTHLGLIFDTDVDRASAVDETGKEIAHNGIVAAAAALIAKEHPGTTVVTDSVTSNELTDFITNRLGLKHLRYKRGYRNVIGKAIELDAQGIDSQLAIETSGHAAYKQNYYLDDGAYLATLIVIETAKLAHHGKSISSLIADLKEPLESEEFRLPFKAGADFASIGDDIINDLAGAASSGGLKTGDAQSLSCSLAEPNYEGVRINFTDDDVCGWLLLRKSLHDPIMPLNIESTVSGGCSKMRAALRAFLSDYPELESDMLAKTKLSD